MSGRVALLAALALGGCANATWRSPRAGEALRSGEVVVVGSFTAVPGFDQYGPVPTNAILVGDLRGNLLAYFASDLSERWDPSPMGSPLSRAETALIPIRGHFFVVVPGPGPIWLRGVVLPTDTGAQKYEAPLRIEVAPGDRVVYVGELKLVRTGGRRLLVREDRATARRAASESGLGHLLDVPWTTRLASP
ncbi:MAG TPA: hypothetical protein VF904_18695 [Anaeromyxobacteraceae bacterium]